MSKGMGIVSVPWKPTKAMLHAAAKAMSPGRRPTQDWMTVNQKHKVRYQAMVAAYLEEQEVGVKHTVHLERAEAELRMLELMFPSRFDLAKLAVEIGDTELAYILEILNDAANDGEGFENYRIAPHPHAARIGD